MIKKRYFKACSKCGEEKEVSEFHKNKTCKSGLRSDCKSCVYIYQKKYNEDNKEKLAEQRKQYNKDNRERFAKRDAKYHQKNRDHRNKKSKDYQQNNKEKIVRRRKKHYQENKEIIAAKGVQYRQKNKEIITKKKKEYQQNNKEKIARTKKKHYQENRADILNQKKQYHQNNSDDICNHKKQERKDKREQYFKDYGEYPKVGTANDLLYIWEAIGERWDDMPVFKIGITSQRLGKKRINGVAREANFTPNILLMLPITDGKASEVEKRILKQLTVIPIIGVFSGSTEFRACTYDALYTIIDNFNF